MVKQKGSNSTHSVKIKVDLHKSPLEEKIAHGAKTSKKIEFAVVATKVAAQEVVESSKNPNNEQIEVDVQPQVAQTIVPEISTGLSSSIEDLTKTNDNSLESTLKNETSIKQDNKNPYQANQANSMYSDNKNPYDSAFAPYQRPGDEPADPRIAEQLNNAYTPRIELDRQKEEDRLLNKLRVYHRDNNRP